MLKSSAIAKPGKVQRTADDKPKGLLYYLGMGISAGLFGLVLMVGAIVIVIPAVAGATPLTVLTSSMEPGLPPGTLIVVKPIATNVIAMGDVLTYQIESGKPGVITHRVTGITNSSDGTRTFTLKGDNNDVADELQVIPVQVVGKLWYSVPWIGNVSNFVNGEGKSWLVPVIALALFIYAGYMIMSGIISSVRKRKRARTKADDEADRAVEQQEADRATIAAAAPIVVAAAPATKPVRKPARKPVAAPANKPARKPAAASADKPTSTTTAKVTRKPVAAPADKPSRKPTSTTPAKATRKPAAAPANKPTGTTSAKATRKPRAAPADKAVRKPARTSAENIARKPTATPTEKAADNPAVKPVRKRKPTID